MIESMFHLHLPILEEILRPVIVYIFLVLLLRLFGKRELAQLNPFDLVVLLSLSNTVQNAIIGEDNSVSGGIIGAFAIQIPEQTGKELIELAPHCVRFRPVTSAMIESFMWRKNTAYSPATLDSDPSYL